MVDADKYSVPYMYVVRAECQGPDTGSPCPDLILMLLGQSMMFVSCVYMAEWLLHSLLDVDASWELIQ